jgi:hypothetical protein
MLAACLCGALSGTAQNTTTNASTAALPAATAQNTKTNTVDSDLVPAPTDYNNWLTLGAGSTFVGGDKAQFQHHVNTANGRFGGVEDFHWQEFVGKQGLFTVDGHAMAANDDYSIKLDLSDPDKGYVRAGYSQYRTWYDNSGGFFPTTSLSFAPLYGNDLHMDRGSAWAEAGLTLPGKPVFTIRVEHDYRQGQMDSTSWGDTTTVTASDKKIVPTFLDINETRDIIQADVKDKLDKTDLGLGVRFEVDRSDDSSYIELDPLNAIRFVTQQNVERDEIFNAHGFTETRLNKMATFSMGGEFTTIDTDLSGSRIYGPTYNAPYTAGYANNGSGFTGLTGGGNTKEYVANMNLMVTPITNLVFVPALRVEYEGGDLSDNFNSTTAATQTPTTAGNNNYYLDVAESLEARYTGFRNWSLYASGEWSEDKGNEVWNDQLAAAVFTPVMNQDWKMLGQKYTVGANWYPLYRLNFSAQYYHQVHDYNYDNNLTAKPLTYPGYLQQQDFALDDMNIRATWRVLDSLSLITRYDFQYSTVDTTSIPNGGTSAGGVQSANITSHIISENISWTPVSRLYVQAGGSYVLNTLDTPVASSAGINNLVLNSANDYWTANGTVGLALDEKTDLQLQYTYYHADDYVNNSASSLPFGAGDEQHSFTATITRRITKALQVSLKYGFYRNRDKTSGGIDNYDAQLVYANMQYRF